MSSQGHNAVTAMRLGTGGPSVSSHTLYHWVTVLPPPPPPHRGEQTWLCMWTTKVQTSLVWSVPFLFIIWKSMVIKFAPYKVSKFLVIALVIFIYGKPQGQIFSCYSPYGLHWIMVVRMSIFIYYTPRERSGSVVECLTWDRGAACSSHTGVTVMCPWARHINPSSVLVQPRKTRLHNWKIVDGT